MDQIMTIQNQSLHILSENKKSFRQQIRFPLNVSRIAPHSNLADFESALKMRKDETWMAGHQSFDGDCAFKNNVKIEIEMRGAAINTETVWNKCFMKPIREHNKALIKITQ